MKKLIALLILTMGLGITIHAQAEPTVVIKQSTANACAKCFDENTALKDANVKFQIAAAKDEVLIASQDKVALTKDKIIDSQATEITALRASIRELMEFIIKRPTTKCVGFINLGC